MAVTSLARSPRTRTGRGIELFREYAGEIERIAPERVSVPSCTGEYRYTVNMETGRCNCKDHPPAGEVCKHAAAAMIWEAKRGELS